MHSRNNSDSGMNYLEGVPIKIGEKFKPPKKITLPLDFRQNIPNEILNDDYNFALEKRVLEWSENFRKRKEDRARAKVDKVGHQIEQFTRRPAPASEGCSVSSDDSPSGSSTLLSSSGDSANECQVDPSGNEGSDERTAKFTNSAVMANLGSNDILKPVTLDPSSTATIVASAENGRGVSAIKLEDFEAESSPFDNVELKTLNDIEELRSVLQGVASSNQMTKPYGYPSGVSLENGSHNMQTKTGFNGPLLYYPAASRPLNGIVTNCLSYPTASGLSYSANEDGANKMWTSTNAPSSLVADFDALTSAYLANDIHVVLPSAGTNAIPTDSNGGLRNARSTPDLLKELGKTLRDEKNASGIRAPRPSSVGPVEDPAVEMNEEQRSLVRRLTDMGFPNDRATRAVEKLGTDDKKVIEHLCAVQSLVEKGFSASSCETALFLHENDENMAKDYLQLTKQFLDLGFEENAIKRALYLNKNDRDKALDYLIS